MSQNNQNPHLIIIGAGFGGLRAARKLAKAPVNITLIDRNNYHLFQPLLYQVATAGLSPEDIAYPVRSILHRQKNVVFQMAEVTHIDLQNRAVHTSSAVLHYDYLIFAAGGQTNFFGRHKLAQHSLRLKSLPDAEKIRSHLLNCFEQAAREPNPEKRAALLTLVVVGGGPSGVESAGAVIELIRAGLREDFPQIHIDEVKVLLLEAGQRLLPAMPPGLSEYTGRSLAQKGVEVRLNAEVREFDGRTIRLADSGSIPAHTMIWTAGIQASPLVGQFNTPLGSLSRVKVGPTLQLPAHPEVFIIGDAACVEQNGAPLPMIAPVAMQQADIAARNISALTAGQPLKKFIYRDLGLMATIGRSAAVARLGRLQFTGFTAWLIWLGVHLIQLMGFRNRLIVLVNWASQYLFANPAVRLIRSQPIANEEPPASQHPAPLKP